MKLVGNPTSIRIACWLGATRLAPTDDGEADNRIEKRLEIPPHQLAALRALAELRRVSQVADTTSRENPSDDRTSSGITQALRAVVPSLTSALGQGLFSMLLQDAEIRACFDEWIAALPGLETSSIELDFSQCDIPEFESLPWEYLAASEARADYIYGIETIVIRRARRRRRQGAGRESIGNPNTLIVATCDSPTIRDHVARIRSALGTGGSESGWKPVVLAEHGDASFEHFKRYLGREAEFELIHLIAPVRTRDGSAELRFQGPDELAWVGVEKVAFRLTQSRRRLVFIQPIHLSPVDNEVPMVFQLATQNASRCMNFGALIGMQGSACLEEQASFAEQFYRQLAAGLSFDEAFHRSRCFVQEEYMATQPGPFATPVLYLWDRPAPLFGSHAPKLSVPRMSRQRPVEGDPWCTPDQVRNHLQSRQNDPFHAERTE